MALTVTFFPKNATIQVEDGTTIIDAAIEAGIPINSICGGEGTCGRCKVIVEGAVEASETAQIDSNEWDNGYRLACQSKIRSDLVVFVPQEAQIGEHKILTTFHVAELGEIAPMVHTRHLSLPVPTLEDNLGDLERVERSLEIVSGDLCCPLEVLRELPGVLRGSDWNVTAFVDENLRLVGITGGEYDREFGLAVDIGTTTVVAALIDLKHGEVISQASDYNKQIVCGEDVLSRIAFCEEWALSRPHNLILDTINVLIDRIVDDFTSRLGTVLSWREISCMSVAGNTTMIHLFLGLDPRGIRYDPYIPVTNLPPVFRAEDLKIRIMPQAPIYIVPGRASYVGGDIVADVLSSELHKSDKTSLLIDVGTNGEIVLGNREWMVACSCSAGPAFEGGEVAYGMRAMMGAIDSIRISDDFEVEYTTIGGTKPLGICGSGLIDLIAEMFLMGIVDKKGRIQDLPYPRIREGGEGREFVVAWAEETGFGKDQEHCPGSECDIVITDNDIQNIIRTKAAVYAAASVLLRSVDMDFSELSNIYVAGGFGNYLDIGKAQVIGLLPDLPEDRFVFLGNGALAGARLTLLSSEKRSEAREIHEMMTYFELSTTQAFFDEFSSSLFLPHTDIDNFPEVSNLLERRS